MGRAFAWLLRALGYTVDLHEAAVFTPDGTPGPHFDHLVLCVRLAEPWLVDVGFGDNHSEPLLLRTGNDQVDRNGTFHLIPAPDASDVAGSADAADLLRDGKPQYRVTLRPHPLSAFATMCRFHQTSPESHFTPQHRLLAGHT